MEPTVHRCALDCCDRWIGRHLLMCIDHWRMVPAPAQREVLRALRAVDRAPLHGALALRRVYLQAREAAIAAVTEKLQARAAVFSKAQPPLPL